MERDEENRPGSEMDHLLGWSHDFVVQLVADIAERRR